MGKVLLVNLGTGIIRIEDLADDYVGISAGPLAGTAVQASCNYSVAAKSPITGFTIYNSHSNGKFARQVKFSGFDAI
jgi:aldehyde:ferredoxin oxidoreductase